MWKDAKWLKVRVWLEGSFYLKSSGITCYLGAVTEEIDFSWMPVHWKEEEFDASGWVRAETMLGRRERDVPGGPCMPPVYPARAKLGGNE